MPHSDYDLIKERIRDAIDIVDLVGRFVPLRRSGRHFVGKCPWHDDSRPSLQVNPDRQSFKCWVCDIGGDIFAFIQQMEKVDFREALKILADLSGIELPSSNKRSHRRESGGNAPADPNALLDEAADGYDEPGGSRPGESSAATNSGNADRKIDKQTLFKAMHWLQGLYHRCLLDEKNTEAQAARDYLKDRGIDSQSIEHFMIGYAPIDYDWLLDKVGKHNTARIKVLERTGNLLRPQENNDSEASSGETFRKDRVFDRFRGRLLFPIRDTLDHVVAFGGRILPNSPLQSKAKYLNSPETELFSKHRLLYGLDLARHAMRKSHRALIMEGYTDCIMAHQHGITDAVAVLGTALGVEHIRLLKRFVDKMVLVLDGDAAGQKRANEVLELFVAQAANLYVLTLPEGADPCEFLEEHGADEFNRMLEEKAIDGLEHAIRSKTSVIDMNNVVEADRALNEILGIIVQSPLRMSSADDNQRIRMEMTLKRISQKFAVPESIVRNRMAELRKANDNKRTYGDRFKGEEKNSEDAASTDPRFNADFDPAYRPEPLERELLELWIADPETFFGFYHELNDRPELLTAPLTKRIFGVWCELINAEIAPSFDSLMMRFDDSRMKNFIVGLDESGADKGLADLAQEPKQQLVSQLIQGLINRNTQRSQPKLINELRDDLLDADEKTKRLLEMMESHKKRTMRPGGT